LLLGAFACGSDQPMGTVTGRVFAGPTCPVEVAGSPCPPATWAGTVIATATDGARREVRTDEAGRFQIELPAGTYEFVAATEAGIGAATPRTVVVEAGVTSTVYLDVDTGIRAPSAA